MTCPTCDHQQAQGKFCGKCGAGLQPAETVNTQTATSPLAAAVQTAMPGQAATADSPYAGKVRNTSQGFAAYFKKYVKSPGAILQTGATEFKNGLILLILTTIVLALALTSLVHSFVLTLLEGLNEFTSFFGTPEPALTPSIISYFLSSFLYIAIPVALVIGILFATVKIFSTGRPIQQLTAFYGTLLFPTLFLSALSLIFKFLNANTYSIAALVAAIVFALIITPVYLNATLLNKSSTKTDAYYGTAIFTIVTFLVLGMYVNYLTDSAFGGVMDQINELRDFGGLF
ncbi:hypothetical protein [Jeotgalibacillus malaysiensis]|uniref:hypothetical protein n=1 Tax=Jeotgalibacillus malaysiensis TaxID=1508404 RepID=UPI0038507979